jgi:hypothetical protein
MKYLLPKEIPAIRIDPFKYKLDGTLRSLEEQARDVKDESEAPELASALASDNVEASSSSPSVAATTGAGSTPSTASKSSSKKLSQRDPAHLDGKVAASPTFVSLFYPLRKQSQPDRISTVEALVILLKELREPDQVTHRLLDLLRRLVDSMRVQSGMNSVYGTYTKAEAKQMRIDVTKKPPPSIESIAAASASTAAASGVQLPLTVVTAKGLVVQTSAALSADGSSLVRVTRKERAQRATAMRPCLQWNRHQPKCAADPCRFAHMCMLCNGQHRAVECKINQPTAGVVQAAVHQHGGELLPLNGAAAASSSSSSSDGFLASALPPPPPQPPAVPSPAVDSDLSASASSANMSISEQVVDTWRCQSRSRRRAPRHMVAMMSLFLAAVLCLASGPPLAECASSASVSPFPPGAFFTGSSFRSDLSHLDTLLALNGTHARLYGHFGYIIRELTGIDFNLTVERVQANFEAHQADFEAQADWSTMDLYIGTFMNATASGHMQPIIELGEGTVDALPKFNRTTERHRKAEEEGIAVEDEKREASESLHPFQQLIHRVYPSFPLELLASTDDGVLHRASNPLSAVGDMVPFDPNLVGVDCYLAYLYLYTRCFLRHYSASPFEYTFTYFQLENELNEAYLAGAGGQRYFQLFGSAWESADFQYELLSTLKSAVLAEQPNAVVTTNLHTDVPEAIHQLIGVPGYYADALQAWVGLLDWYAFDSYPNMFCAVPLEATARLSAILRTMRSIVPEDAFIVVMETGFGSLAHGVIATNDSAQWTEENQSLYAQQAFEAVQANGAQGFLWFSVAQSAGMQLTFEPDDYQMLTLLGDLLHSDASSSSILALVEWSLSNLGYVTGQFGRIVGQVDRAWGTNRADGSARPVVETLQQLYQSTARASRCDDAAGSGA